MKVTLPVCKQKLESTASLLGSFLGIQKAKDSRPMSSSALKSQFSDPIPATVLHGTVPSLTVTNVLNYLSFFIPFIHVATLPHDMREEGEGTSCPLDTGFYV